ncbi:hypothetical protein IPG41_02730 [Candidatus Peregrinibacteria bacterium]|nr:MAG: hypothetical protein IPG41_02730 [Candidatus Peregrinibacteria bacterium]
MGIIIFIFLAAAYVFTFGWAAKETALYAARTGHNPLPWAIACLFLFLLPTGFLYFMNLLAGKHTQRPKN